MTTTTSSLVRPVTLFRRVVSILADLLAVIASVQLYIVTDHTDHCFAWTIVEASTGRSLHEDRLPKGRGWQGQIKQDKLFGSASIK
jgi:hypothetical protein